VNPRDKEEQTSNRQTRDRVDDKLSEWSGLPMRPEKMQNANVMHESRNEKLGCKQFDDTLDSSMTVRKLVAEMKGVVSFSFTRGFT